MDNNTTEENNINQTPNPVPATTQAIPNEKGEGGKYIFNEKTITASLSYVGPLVLFPFLTKKDDAFTNFHIKQGLVLFGLELILMFANMMTFYVLTSITFFINIGLLILSIIGILNTLKMQEKMVPLTGKWAEKIDI